MKGIVCCRPAYGVCPAGRSGPRRVAARDQGESPLDIVEITDSTWPETLAAGFVEKMDRANIPNLADPDANMYEENKAANRITREGFIVHLEKFEEPGIERPIRFIDLFHPKLEGKITIPDISVNTVLTTIVGFAAEKGATNTTSTRGSSSSGISVYSRSGTPIVRA